MKIVFTLSQAFNPNNGGVQRTTYKLGKHFTEIGFEVSYFSLHNEGHIVPEYGQLFHSDLPGRDNNNENIKKLKETLLEIAPDIVINQMPYEQPLREALYESKQAQGYLLLGCLRNSLFSVKNNISDIAQRVLPKSLAFISNNALGRFFLQKIHRRKHSKQLKAILDLHDYYILLAPPNKKELAYFVGDYKSEKVKWVPNSIPEVSKVVPKKEKIILHVGSLNIPQKRSDLLIPIWKSVYEKLPDWEFVVVGDGVYKPTMDQQIKEENIPRITLTGRQAPEEYYRKAAIFVMPSAFEGFPNVILEAQSYGMVPVAFNSYAALEWIVNDSKDAMLVPAFDIKKMAQSLEKLANQPNLLPQMAEQARINASNFTIDKVGEQWLTLFNEIMPK